MATNGKSRASIHSVAEALREIALAKPEGTLLGGELELVDKLGVSRATVRQAARLLEREGVLRVRRGINGGYFAARPKIEMLESVFCGYLNTLGIDAAHGGAVATGLWVESLRQAAGANRDEARALAFRLAEKLEQLDPDATLADLNKLEQETRSAIFELIDGSYIELLFRINAAFARQQLGHNIETLNQQFEVAHPESHRSFVNSWKKTKLMELEAVASGDATMAMIAGLHNRKLWISRGSEQDRRSAGFPS